MVSNDKSPVETFRPTRDDDLSVGQAALSSMELGAIPATILTLICMLLFGLPGLVALGVPFFALLLEFSLRKRLAGGKDSFVAIYRNARIESRCETFLDRCRWEFNDPKHIRAAFRSIATLNPKLAWAYVEELIRISTNQTQNERWRMLREIPRFLEDRPEKEIEAELKRLRDLLRPLQIEILLAPDPLFDYSEIGSVWDPVVRRTVYSGVKHDLNIDFQSPDDLFSESLNLASAVELLPESYSVRWTWATEFKAYQDTKALELEMVSVGSKPIGAGADYSDGTGVEATREQRGESWDSKYLYTAPL